MRIKTRKPSLPIRKAIPPATITNKKSRDHFAKISAFFYKSYLLPLRADFIYMEIVSSSEIDPYINGG
ncbi:hypothetical protein PghCCS26_44470 [Paenibacillus glycanilyticus]|uniref:Uncharacterized protein n=1 Tax=Paenibacillus glycanilyticus TaxID=126569 RepID=A0ABQ6NSZ2_9BACL|nr:hypothetical protein PghCCS26_44470 [Paenibacillus glycanilyticus]